MIAPEELKLFAQSVQRAAEQSSGAALDKTLQELGWAEALAAVPQAAVRVLFDAQGRSGATSSALSTVLCTGMGIAPSALVLPALGSSCPPGRRHGEAVTVAGVCRSDGLDPLLVVTQGDEGGISGLRVPAAELGLSPADGLAPLLELKRVTAVLPSLATPSCDALAWPEALRLGRLALASELLGSGRAMLQLARAHALDREQFGRPIATFQAVRHRLSDTLIALEAADALVDAAWLDGTTQTAAMAKAEAGRAADTAARHCQQVLAGIGFTTEHRLHLYVRRVFVLGQLLGSSRSLTRELGEQVLTQRRLPLQLPL